MTNGQPLNQSHDKWIVTTMWLAILLATLYTSNYGATVLNFGFFSRAYAPAGPLAGLPSGQRIAVFLGLILVVFAFIQIARAWLGFISLTRELIISYIRLNNPEEKNTPFASLLVFETEHLSNETKEEDSEPDPEEAKSTLVSDVVRPLGYAWMALFATSALNFIANLNLG